MSAPRAERRLPGGAPFDEDVHRWTLEVERRAHEVRVHVCMVRAGYADHWERLEEARKALARALEGLASMRKRVDGDGVAPRTP